MVPMPTKAELKKFAPRIKDDYLEAILSLKDDFKEAGVLDDKLTLCHFLGQFGAETNGGVIIRENMNYTSTRRIRQVWPSRARRYSDSWISSNLVRNPKRLSAWAYGGRMGNAKWPSPDGYDYRGGGMLQTTGKWMTSKYCAKIGVECTPDVLDDCAITTRFALYEWRQSGCNKYALQNDLLSVSKIINTGSATSGVRPNGMTHRQRWFKRAWTVFGEPERKYIPEASTVQPADLRGKGSQTMSIGDLATKGAVAGGVASGVAGAATDTSVVPPPPLPPAPDVSGVISQMQTVGQQVDIVTSVTQSTKAFAELVIGNWWITGIVFSVAGIYVARKLIQRRTTDARLAQNTAYLDQLDPVDESLVSNQAAVIPR
jgi:putative chitinase